jgi:tetratricopeptide (TPR) repeat protein
MPGSAGIEQSHIFEQYTNVLKALAAQRPLMLVLDDLQWADAASIGLLFRLGRRIGESRVLIVGTYRPDEVALGRAGERHPLEKVLAEFKRYFGDIWVNLDQAEEAERRQFVDAFLGTEPNRLGEGFRRALYRHTGGHPLFTIELLRDMQERGDLVQDEEGRWIEGSVLDWGTLPARVEGVIEERIGRLEQELLEALTVASVEGEDFTAEVVARVQAVDARGLIRRLSGELEKQHRLVSARGIRRLDAQCLSLYRFRHNLFQKYLYSDLDEVERAYLHEDVGNVLEELYGDQVDEISVQLARHFVEAGVAEKAINYLHRAGEQAAVRFANAEAVTYFSRALDLTPETDYTECYALLLAREKVYDLQGEREAQRQDLAALEGLAETLDDDRRRAEVALRQADYAEVTGDYPEAITMTQAAVRLGQVAQDVESEARGYQRWGMVLWRQGDYEAARSPLEHALALARGAGLGQVEARSLHSLGVVSWRQGDYGGAKACYEQAMHLCQEIGDRRGKSMALANLGNISLSQGDYAVARAYYEQATRLDREIGSRRGESMALGNLGIISSVQGDYAGARAYFGQVLRIFREIGDQEGEGRALAHLGKASHNQGDYAGARVHYEQALHIFREIGNRQAESWVLTELGLLFHQLGDDEVASEYSRQALHIAQELGIRSGQAHGLTNLGHAQTSLDHLAEAADAYREALVIRHEVGEHHLAMESLAGLARVSLAQGEIAQALAQVEDILNHLETKTLDGTAEPFRVYLTCYRVLRANQAPRAQAVLNTAYNLLQERAAKISDEELRRSFLENVAAHREILSEWANSE